MSGPDLSDLDVAVTALRACEAINPDNPLAVAEQIGEAFDLLRFILRGIERGKIEDANFIKPHAADAESADVSCLSEEIRALLARIEEKGGGK